MLLVLQLEIIPHSKDRTWVCCALLCCGFLLHHVGTEATSLLFSVKSTFTTKRLKPPPDIQLFTSDKPPSSAPMAGGATVTSTWLHFTCCLWLIKTNQSTDWVLQITLFHTRQHYYSLVWLLQRKAQGFFFYFTTLSFCIFFFFHVSFALVWCSYFCYSINVDRSGGHTVSLGFYTARTISAEILSRCFLQYKQYRHHLCLKISPS